MKRYILQICLAAFTVFCISSCESNFLDVNDNPNQTKEPVIAQLLTGSQVNLGALMGGDSRYPVLNMSTFVQHLAAVSPFNLQPNHAYVLNQWSRWYVSTAPNLEEIIRISEENDYMIYAGVARIMHTYGYSIFVDLYGPIPYSEANIPGTLAPHPDADDVIYNKMLKQLDEAIANLTNTTSLNARNPKDEKADYIFGGDKDKWLRLAYTLKLKLLVQSRLAKDKIEDWSGQLAAVMAANKFMQSGGDFQFQYNNVIYERIGNGYGTDSRVYINPWFKEIMNGDILNATNNPFSGIVDPRIPYFWYRQATSDETVQGKFEYRDNGFVSIPWATAGGTTGMDGNMTALGIYPVGGKYDDGKGAMLGEKSGTGAAPLRFVTYYALNFLLAELAQVGEIAGSPRDYLKVGIEASINHVNSVVPVAKGSEVVPSISKEDMDSFVASVLAKYDAANAERQLEIIMTQKWIASFYQPFDCYTDYRRTGYPILYNPSDHDNVYYSPESNDPDMPGTPIIQVSYQPTRLTTKFPKSLFYPNNEVLVNKNIKQKGAELNDYPIFWDTRTYTF